MSTNEARSNKTEGIDSKPATIVLSGGGTVDVAHHIVPSDKDVVHAYIDRDGIDATLPLNDVAAIVRDDADDDAMREVIAAVNASRTPSDDAELVADGGAVMDRPVHGFPEKVPIEDVEVGDAVAKNRDEIVGRVVEVNLGDDARDVSFPGDSNRWDVPSNGDNDGEVIIEPTGENTTYLKKFTHATDSIDGEFVCVLVMNPLRAPERDTVDVCEYCGEIVLHEENHGRCDEVAAAGGDDIGN